MAVGIFFLCSPKCPKQPRTSFSFYKSFYPTISCRIFGDSAHYLAVSHYTSFKECQFSQKQQQDFTIYTAIFTSKQVSGLKQEFYNSRLLKIGIKVLHENEYKTFKWDALSKYILLREPHCVGGLQNFSYTCCTTSNEHKENLLHLCTGIL